MAEFQWQGNAEAMYKKMVSSAPLPFRKMTESRMVKCLTEKCGDGGEVTELHIEEAVREITPPAFVEKALKSLSDLRS